MHKHCAFQPVYMSISVYEPMYCVSRQMQLTYLSINTDFGAVVYNRGKVISCSCSGDHFAEHEREQGRKEGEELEEKRDYPIYVNPLQLDLAV